MATQVKIKSNAAGTGIITVQAAQGSADVTLTAPAKAGTIATTADIPNTSVLVNKSGNRGTLGGYETLVAGTNVTATSSDSLTASGNLTIKNGAANTSWTKTVAIPNVITITLGSQWLWAGSSAPEVKANSILVCSWQGSFGLLNLISP